MKKRSYSLLIQIIIMATVVIWATISIQNFQMELDEKEVVRLKDTITRAAMTCYSIEGIYPADVEYLEDNYGVIISRDKYHVFYETYGSNIKTEIEEYRM